MKVRTIAVIAALPMLAACGSVSHPDSSATSGAPATSAPAVPAAAPTPSAAGTYKGSCDYTLGSNPAGGTAVAVGEIDEKNTGNVGEKARVKISWPQEGFAPITETRHVRVAFGAGKAVRFHVPLSSTQLDNLQNWQQGHNYNDGCHYHTTITGTYGLAH
jgi:hypothetical protein